MGNSPVYFISYKTDDKNDGIVRDIFRDLPPGEKHWLDKHAKDVSTKGMRMGIEEADAFLMVLSPKYFESEYCCMEVHRALTLGKPIMPIYNKSEYRSRDALKWIPEELARLKDMVLLPVSSDDFEHMKLELKKIQNTKPQKFKGEVPEKIGKYRFDDRSRKIITVEAVTCHDIGENIKSATDIKSGKQDVQHSVQEMHATDEDSLLATDI